jgi:hypothetical protein
MDDRWPALPFDEWRDTYATLHMWSQMVGKVALAFTAPLNHFWNIAFLLTPRGFSTHPLTAGARTFTIEFDFIDHQLAIRGSDGTIDRLPLAPRSVKTFYGELMALLRANGVDVRIWPMPVEIADPIRFDRDEIHASYDRAAVERFWRAIVSMRPVFEQFRCRFVGKSSPVHFFWGSFDLASTRFSGARAPERPNADAITREAYSHAVISHGFWPGNATLREPVFYAYAAPEPDGFPSAAVQPREARYDRNASEFLLPYEAVRRAATPERTLLSFLETTYDAGATLAQWNRGELEKQNV